MIRDGFNIKIEIFFYLIYLLVIKHSSKHESSLTYSYYYFLYKIK